jgi:hypothetical protein
MGVLRGMIEELGWTLTVYRRPINWAAVRSGANVLGPWVHGTAMTTTKRIVITTLGRPSRANILHCLAHELRHAQHYTYGLFKDYYREEDVIKLYKWYDGKTKRPRVKVPSPQIGYFAELDCDRFATKFLKTHDVEYECGEYPFFDNLAHRVSRSLRMKGLI